MVRLRREIEGIAVNYALPLPTYALDRDADNLILPTLDGELEEIERGRVLVAGVPTVARVTSLVQAGHHVTVVDIPRDEVDVFVDALGEAIAAKITIVDKPYNEASFGPSSFDAILLFDTMHRFAQPRWVAQKAFRELKYDGHLICRLWVQGDAPAHWRASGSTPSRVPSQFWQKATQLWRSPAHIVLLRAQGRDAIDRGASLSQAMQAGSWNDTVAALSEKLAPVRHITGHTQRLAAISLLYDARSALRTGLTRTIALTPELADSVDMEASEPRVIGGWWRKQLGGAKLRL